MRWQDIGQSSNVEDRRGMGGRGIALGGGSLGMVVLAAVVWLCSGGDLRSFLDNLQGGEPGTQVQQPGPASNSTGPGADQNRQFLLHLSTRQLRPQNLRGC